MAAPITARYRHFAFALHRTALECGGNGCVCSRSRSSLCRVYNRVRIRRGPLGGRALRSPLRLRLCATQGTESRVESRPVRLCTLASLHRGLDYRGWIDFDSDCPSGRRRAYAVAADLVQAGYRVYLLLVPLWPTMDVGLFFLAARSVTPNTALRTDKGKLLRFLRSQGPRRLAEVPAVSLRIELVGAQLTTRELTSPVPASAPTQGDRPAGYSQKSDTPSAQNRRGPTRRCC